MQTSNPVCCVDWTSTDFKAEGSYQRMVEHLRFEHTAFTVRRSVRIIHLRVHRTLHVIADIH